MFQNRFQSNFRVASLLASASVVLLSSPAFAAELSLIGSELGIDALFQLTPTSEIFRNSFPVTATVSESEVEFPNAASLFDPSPIPREFGTPTNTSIDVGADFIAIDFDSVSLPFGGSGRFTSGFQNSSVYVFTAPIALQIADAVIDPQTNIGLTPDRIAFEGNELFVNVESLAFTSDSFVRINLEAIKAPEPTPEPPSEPMPNPIAIPEPGATAALLLTGAAGRLLKSRRSQ